MPQPVVCEPRHARMTTDPPATPGPPYRGRFAPTPSGPLHLGSLLTALASWLQARVGGGQWLLRIDDLDRERCVAGMDATILRQLEAHALEWDEAPRRQSQHVDEYEAALSQLRAGHRTYACGCTRARLAAESRAGPDGPVYAGTCRSLHLDEAGNAVRLRIGQGRIHFRDGWQGEQARDLASEVGDFVLQRRDAVPGYQLACAVDEHAQRITEVVRGADLLGSTFCQAHLMDLLDFPRPAYRHLPVLVDASGRKLSKQNHAAPLSAAVAGENLWLCLNWLGQNPPPSLRTAPARELLAWAVAHWLPGRVPGSMHIRVEQPC